MRQTGRKDERKLTVNGITYAFLAGKAGSLFLPETLEKAGKYVFYRCFALKKLCFGDAFTDIGAGAFTGCRLEEIKKENFYRMETTVDGKMFVTARGWEDLSQFLYACGRIGKKADREVVRQYLQHWKAAKDFANYLELYEKYKKDYGLERIAEGIYTEAAVERVKCAPFDERLSVVGILSGKVKRAVLQRIRKGRVCGQTVWISEAV